MSSSTPLKIISNEFAEIKIYEDFIISCTKEGLVFDQERLKSFFELVDKFYPNKKFGYIANRIYDYAIDPMIYHTVSVHENLSAIAIVCHNSKQRDMALYEKTFYPRNFEIFSNVEDAIYWIKNTI